MRELNTEEKLLDFIAFILADYSELLDDVNYFFSENYPPNKKLLANYKKNIESNFYKFFLKENIYIESILKKINISENFNFTDNEKKVIINYINENYIHGYPDDVDEEGHAYGGRYRINLDLDQFNSYFDEYLSLCEITNNVYVSFFKYYLIEFEDSVISSIVNEYNSIKKLFLKKNDIKPDCMLDFIDTHKKRYKLNYLETYHNKNLFFIINKSDNDKFILDLKSSLKLQITKITEQNIEIKYSTDFIKLNDSLNEFYYDLYLNIFENKPINKNYINEDLIYNNILNEKKEYINYLNDKGFENNDVNAILNILSNNSLSEQGFSFLKRYNLKQVEIFHLLYSFYVFDFFKEVKKNELTKIKDFEAVINFQSLKSKLNTQQFRKYFNSLDESDSKHYPFNNYDETFKLFNNILEKTKLLKSKPKSKNFKYF